MPTSCGQMLTVMEALDEGLAKHQLVGPLVLDALCTHPLAGTSCKGAVQAGASSKQALISA